MTRDEYKEKYVNYLVANSGLNKEEAENNFEASDFGDYTYAPEYAAADEMSYWAENQ